MEVKKFDAPVLLPLLALLVGLKFGIVPIMEWQQNKIDRLSATYRQYEKLVYASLNQDSFEKIAESLRAQVIETEALFHIDGEQLKLDRQKEIEALFIQHQLVITRFNWVFDASDSIRTLRATVHFSGSVDNMMAALWELATKSQFTRQVEWQQQIRMLGDNDRGSTVGRITLEFYALTRVSDSAVGGVNVGNNAQGKL